MFHNNYTQQEYHPYHLILPPEKDSQLGGLLLGDLNSATDENMIAQHQVKTIITAATGLQHLNISAQLTHIVFPLVDHQSQDIQAYFQMSFQAIEQHRKRGSVLVHCGAGISRSATLVIAYYMKKYQTIFSQAIKFVRKIRPNICPNLGFELQLKKYQQKLAIGDPNKKKPLQLTKHSSQDGQAKKKSFVQPKEMLLTFTQPLDKPKPNSRNGGGKVFNTTTPSLPRKMVHHSSHKNNYEGDLFIVGHQARQFKNQSMYNPQNYWPKGAWRGKKKEAAQGFKL